jgi:hypothetical protein
VMLYEAEEACGRGEWGNLAPGLLQSSKPLSPVYLVPFSKSRR